MIIFGKLGGLYGRVNLISKPMQIFTSDETGVSIVHKPRKVVVELGQYNVYALSLQPNQPKLTLLSCESASGYVLPPMMVFHEGRSSS